ncbi:MAG: hypothetical protein KA795_18805, partial [Burkholderiaceae bacterium]|nr:hypothetical protein [Burkholderiaceae bacterium]
CLRGDTTLSCEQLPRLVSNAVGRSSFPPPPMPLGRLSSNADLLSAVSKFDSPMFKYGDGRTASSADVVDSDVPHCL